MLDTVKTLLGITTAESDPVLQIMIDDAQSAVRDACNRKDCPEQLDYLVRELVIQSFMLNNEGNVSSVKRGDTQINYNSTITTEAFTDRQRAAMYPYRKIKMC